MFGGKKTPVNLGAGLSGLEMLVLSIYDAFYRVVPTLPFHCTCITFNQLWPLLKSSVTLSDVLEM